MVITSLNQRADFMGLTIDPRMNPSAAGIPKPHNKDKDMVVEHNSSTMQCYGVECSEQHIEHSLVKNQSYEENVVALRNSK
jgi:hypothetical protein